MKVFERIAADAGLCCVVKTAKRRFVVVIIDFQNKCCVTYCGVGGGVHTVPGTDDRSVELAAGYFGAKVYPSTTSVNDDLRKNFPS